MSKVKAVPYWDLSVTVLQAKLNRSYDYFSKSDCYVTLELPTSSLPSNRTRTVPNINNPMWNETFHFSIHSHIKNVLEIRLYDSDKVTRDDLISILLFDISQLCLGQKETKIFKIYPEDELWVEFELEESLQISGMCCSNGVLMATPIPETELSVQGNGRVPQTKSPSVPLNLLKTEQQRQDSFKQGRVDLDMRTVDWLGPEPAVRLDFDIPSEEKQFLEKRKVVVGRALQKLLQLSSPPDTEKVPLVGVVCSGGGTRAMTGTFGSLKALQTLGILDAVSYICGVSGSTWAMSTLFENHDWSQKDFGLVTEPIKQEMLARCLCLFSNEQSIYYKKEMEQREADGLQVSITDLWGLLIEHLIYGKKWDTSLSDQKRAVSEGQNPLPIYTAVNKKTKGKVTENEWCEFTPFEVGLLKYGAFIPTEDFGSQYSLGYLKKKLPESRLSFLIGIWSSVFSISFTQMWTDVTGHKLSWTQRVGEIIIGIETDSRPSTLDTLLVKPTSKVAKMITDFLNSRPMVSQVYNFMHGLRMHWDYNKNSNFTDEKEDHPDVFPNQLTPVDPIMDLVDSGLACNTAFTPLLRSHRRMDLILSLNYSWDPDQFMVLKKTQQHCSDHKIPFPHIDFSRVEKEPMKEVYVFEDENNPKAPIVVHFPMVNLSFREFKAPGVRREGKEKEQGDVDVSTKDSPYRTRNLAYQPEDFQKLMDLTYYNVLNNRDILLSALRKALQRERVQEEDLKDHSCP